MPIFASSSQYFHDDFSNDVVYEHSTNSSHFYFHDANSISSKSYLGKSVPRAHSSGVIQFCSVLKIKTLRQNKIVCQILTQVH